MCQFAVCLSLLAIIWRKVSNNSAKEEIVQDCCQKVEMEGL